MRSLRHDVSVWSFVAVTFALGSLAEAGELTVLSTEPPRNTVAPIGTKIVIHFNQPVAPASVTPASFRVYGRWSAAGPGTFTFSDNNQTVTLTPARAFSAGETVSVVLSHDLMAADGSPFRAASYSYQFRIHARPAAMSFFEIDVMSNRSDPDISTRLYGAAASDLDADGWLDLTTVNENSADLRVFMNLGDGTGLYTDWLEPPFAIGIQASPNEPADFNGDGKADLAIAASTTNDVWITLGSGDGTYVTPPQSIPVGAVPHGLAVLDVDGDGDTDVATSNTSGNNVSLMLNDGSGVFGAASNFEGGGSGEYGLSAADMNNDGIMDLVVGARFSQTIIIQRGNGNGTFTPMPPQSAGGLVWMIACGDVNGDGNVDVSTSNSDSNNGAILLGNGAGGLSAPTTYAAGPSAVATDLGDLDGDGDLDWILSSYGGGCWRVYENNGAGSFAFDQDFEAPQNASCAILLDFDNDRDLDLALADEVADVLLLEKNSGTVALADFNNDQSIDLADYDFFAACMNGLATTPPPGCTASQFALVDISGDGDADLADFSQFGPAFTGP